jgi:glycosyltransferase involved in cell wall biosynthesis
MKVVLTMIVKDEEHVIERALLSCVDLIDAYCIVDTGSTDKTKEVIENFFANHKRIEGEIVDFPFTNFQECRNKSIEVGKNYGDWGFWMDADEELQLNSKWNKNEFKANVIKDKPDQILFDCIYSSLRYNRAQLFKFSSGYNWYGPVHEVLRSDKKDQAALGFPYGTVLIRPDGNSWKGDISKKYEEHAEILLKYQEDNNWEDPRWTFYLAQSFKDASLPVILTNPKDERGLDLARKSINFYRDRINAKGGFAQEVYYSQLMIARISYYFSTHEQLIYEFQKCEEYNWDNRIEHIFDLTTIYKDKQLWRNAKIYGDHAHTLLERSGQDPVSKGRGTRASLFVEKDLYTWRFYDNFSIVLYYNGLINESLKVIKWILTKHSKAMPDHERERIENNRTLIEDALSARSGIQLPSKK